MIVSAKWQNADETQADITLDTGQVWSGVTKESRFWQDLQIWIRQGNTPDPFIPPLPPLKSEENLSAEEVATELVRKGLVSRAEFDSIKNAR